MTATDPTTLQRRVSGFASEMREKGIHVGINGRCACGTPWPCNGSATVPTAPAQPATPGQALDVDAIEQNFRDWDNEGVPGPWEQGLALVAEVRRLTAERDMLAKAVVHPQRLVDATKLDAAPAAPDKLAADFAKWLEHRDLPPETSPAELIQLERDVAAMHARFEPLSSAPPAGTEADQ